MYAEDRKMNVNENVQTSVALFPIWLKYSCVNISLLAQYIIYVLIKHARSMVKVLHEIQLKVSGQKTFNICQNPRSV